MPASPVLRHVARYGIAVLSIAVAVLLRVLLTDLVGRESPFLLCLIAVAVTAWYAGFGPALLATALGTLENAADAARHSIRSGPIDEVLSVALFAVVACALALIANARRLSERARDESLAKERDARRDLEGALSSLAASEERYRLVAAVTNDALWDYDVRRGRIAWSDGVRRVFGYKPEQVREHLQWWSDRIHPDDRDRVTRSFEMALGGDAVSWSEQYRFRAAGGSYATVVDRAHVLRDGVGHALRVVGSMLDITAVTEAQRALRKNQLFLRRLIRAVPSLIVLLDPAGRVVLFNRAAEHLTGFRRRDVVGRFLSELLIMPQDAARFRGHLVDPLAPTVRQPLRTAIRTRDGHAREVEWHFAPLQQDAGPDLPHLMVTGVDVTDRAEPEAELRAERAFS
jgi:PAS domain S-box-containing protein